MSATPPLIRVNHAPVLTLWATVVAERLGHPPETALTLGHFVVGSSARAKARRLGMSDEKQRAEERHARATELKPRRQTVRLLGGDIPVLTAADGTLRVEDDAKPASCKSVASSIARAFGDRLGEARAAMHALAASLPPGEQNRVGFRLYEEFRPDVPEGAQGWGAKGKFRVERIVGRWRDPSLGLTSVSVPSTQFRTASRSNNYASSPTRSDHCSAPTHDRTTGEETKMSDTPTFGRYAEIPYEQMTSAQQEGYRAVIESRGGLPGPSKIWVHNPKLAKVAGPFGAHFHAGHYSLTEREREIAVCVITSKFHSAYPTSAHERRGKEVGLPADKVEAIITGLPTSFTDEREQVVYEMAIALTNARWVPRGLYDRAVRALDHVGITDVITLMGHYSSVAMTLAFYDVPAGATGMAR